jgi:serine/threonine protein kinase
MSDDRSRRGEPTSDEDATRVSVGSIRSTGSASGVASPIARNSNSPPVQIGEVLGHTYRAEAFLGQGGMGAVYRARHIELESQHAIKIILSDLSEDPQIIALLSQEAKALRSVRNDAVVAYEGLFLDEHGRRYLVMEFVDGPSLASVLENRRFSPSDVRMLRDRLAGGLAAAHETGIFHRDVSPENVILPAGRIDYAKLIDFGIAKSTQTGERTIIGRDFTGKYSFASPEQAGMFGGTVDGRSDIYSLGLVLASAAIGYGGKLEMGHSPSTMIEARQSVPDLSRLPEDLRDEIAAMLQPRPEQRVQAMKDVVGLTAEAAHAIAARAAGRVRVASGQSSAAGRRARLPVVLGLLCFVAAVVGTAAYELFFSSDRAVVRQSDDAERVAGSEADKRDADRSDVPAAAETPMGGSNSGTTPEISPPATQSPGEATPPSRVAVILPTRAQIEAPVRPEISAPATQTRGEANPSPQVAVVQPTRAQIEAQVRPEISPPATQTRGEATPPPQVAVVLPTRAQIESQVRNATQGYYCSDVRSVVTDEGTVQIAGFVSTASDLARLQSAIANIPNIRPRMDSVAVYSWPHCEVIKLIRAAGPANDAAGPHLQFNMPSLVYRAGETLIVHAAATSAYDGYLYVDYLDNDGNVVHMLPTDFRRNNAIRPRQEVVLGTTKEGGKAGGRVYEISEPFGSSMVMAISSPKPLFPRRSAEQESAKDYLPILENALKATAATGDAKVMATYVMIRSVPN